MTQEQQTFNEIRTAQKQQFAAAFLATAQNFRAGRVNAEYTAMAMERIEFMACKAGFIDRDILPLVAAATKGMR